MTLEIPEQYRALLATTPRTRPPYVEPKVLLAYGPAKHGKTESTIRIKGARLVDMDAVDGGTKYVGQCDHEPFRPKGVQEFREFCAACREVKPYSAVVFDHLTAIEELAKGEATLEFRDSPIGKGLIKDKKWDGEDITEVPGRDGGGGPGWGPFRRKFRELLTLSAGCADRVVWIAHLREKYGEAKDVREAEVCEINLVGQNKVIATSMADAFAFISRSKIKPTDLMLTFRVKDPLQGGGGSRCKHLEGQELVIARMEQGVGGVKTLRTFWELVYPELYAPGTEPAVKAP